MESASSSEQVDEMTAPGMTMEGSFSSRSTAGLPDRRPPLSPNSDSSSDSDSESSDGRSLPAPEDTRSELTDFAEDSDSEGSQDPIDDFEGSEAEDDEEGVVGSEDTMRKDKVSYAQSFTPVCPILSHI